MKNSLNHEKTKETFGESMLLKAKVIGTIIGPYDVKKEVLSNERDEKSEYAYTKTTYFYKVSGLTIIISKFNNSIRKTGYCELIIKKGKNSNEVYNSKNHVYVPGDWETKINNAYIKCENELFNRLNFVDPIDTEKSLLIKK